jgi:hypothetical protein
MFDLLKEDYHQCGMDNLYISAKFISKAYKHDQKILVGGVCRKGGCGFPAAVLQEDVKSRVDQIKVRGTVKAAVLEGDNIVPNLVAVSVYNTKRVHLLSMSSESIEWITKERKVFATSTGRYKRMKFLQLNVNDNLNKEMGHVAVLDQLRNYYRFDHYMRKRKWWWSLAFWGIGVQFVNAYVVYCKVMEASGTPKKDWFSHYDFRKSVALEWIHNKQDFVARKRSFITMIEERSDKDESPDKNNSRKKKEAIKAKNANSNHTNGDNGSKRSLKR